jgi:tetratricopeptide (TPR) repeat protein
MALSRLGAGEPCGEGVEAVFQCFGRRYQVKIHPSDFMLEEALAELGGERQLLLLHLAVCARCRARVGGLASSACYGQSKAVEPVRPGTHVSRLSTGRGAVAGDGVDYGAIIEKSEHKYRERAHALQEERADASALVAELVLVPAEKRTLLIANSARFQTWGVLELLLENSWELRRSNRAQAEELARLAVLLSDYLDTSYYRSELIDDLRARAWSYISNLRRIAADLEGAETALSMAYEHLKRGTREPLERALFLDLKASLRHCQRRFPESTRLLRRSVAIFLRHGDRHRAGKSLVSLSLVFSDAGDAQAAIPTLKEAVDLIDPSQDERLLLSAWHNLIWYLTQADRFIEAQGLYRKALPLYRKHNDAHYGCRRLWVKGRIERGLGQEKSAEDLFVAARERCFADALPYEAALVSLELALLYAEQDRTAELKQLAAEIVPVFASRKIHREALAALIFLKQAVEAERVSVEVVSAIADFLKLAAADSGLKFEAPV